MTPQRYTMTPQKYTLILLNQARVAAVAAQLIHLKRPFECVPLGERSRVGVRIDDADTLLKIVENMQTVELQNVS